MIENYNQSLKSRILSQFGKKIQVDIFGGCKDIVHLQQINIKDNVNESEKNWLFIYN